MVAPSPVHPDRARITYLDGEGQRLEDEVLAGDLDRYLAETRRLLRESPAPAYLHLRFTDDWREVAVARSEIPPRRAELGGALPFGLKIKVDDEWFGRGCAFGWTAATLAVFSQWAPGERGVVAIDKIALEGRGGERPLLRLYARSVALRRLSAQAVAGGLT